MSFNTKGLMSSYDQCWKTPTKIYDYYVRNGFFDVCQGLEKFNNCKTGAPFPSMIVRLCSYGMDEYFTDFRYYSKDKMKDIYDYDY